MATELTVPELDFPSWVAWEDRMSLSGVEYPGVYLVALSTQSLVRVAPQWEVVSYIGMTNSVGGLISRWQQFDRAVRGKGGHSGGNLMFKRKGHRETWEEELFVTAKAVECEVSRAAPEDLHQMGIVAYLEYDAFARYSARVGGRPPFNTH